MTTTEPPAHGWEPRVDRVVGRVFVVFVAAAFLPQLRLVVAPETREQRVLLGCLAVVLVVGASVLVTRLSLVHELAMAACFVTAAAVEVARPDSSTGADTVGSYIFCVGVLLTVGLSGRPGRYALVALVTGAVYVTGRLVAQGSGVWDVAVDELVAAATTCAAFAFLVRGLRSAARNADLATAVAQHVEAARDRATTRRSATEEMRRVLHDEVIASLVAVDVLGATDPVAARSAAERAVRALDGSLDVTALEIPTLETTDMSSYGFPATEVTIDPDVTYEDTPAEVVAAVSGAVAEALRNVQRHSGVDAATIQVSRDAEGFAVTVRDEGEGFAPDAVEGFGLTSSIRGRMSEVGGSVEVDTAAGRGTTVRVGWRPSATPATRWGRAFWTVDVAVGVRALILGALTWFIAGQTWMAVRWVPENERAGLAAAVLVAVLVQNVVVIRRVTRGPVSPPIAVLAVTSSVALMLVGLYAAGPGALRNFESWVVGSAEPVLMALAVVTPLRFAIASSFAYAGAVAAVGVADPSVSPWEVVAVTIQSPLHVAMISIVVVAIRRIGRAASAQEASLGLAAMFEGREIEASEQHELQVEGLRRSIAPFLGEVRSGGVDVEDPLVRTRARVLAAWVRDELHLPGLLDSPSRRAIGLARARGAAVELRVDHERVLDVAGFRRAVTALAALVPDDGVLTISLGQDAPDLVATLKPPVPEATLPELGVGTRIEGDDLVSWVVVPAI